MIMVSHWSLNYDENVFENPKSFVPDRFLEKDGKSVSKIQQNMMPFQVGRRRCVGEDFGKAMVIAFVIKFLSCFRLKLSTPYDFHKEPAPGFTRAPNPFNIIMEPILYK